MINHYRQAHFVLGAHRLDQLPADEGAEIAFAGRSNAGKSSALNAICEQRTLARTSKTPGRTQQINVFQLEEACRLVDLPGYGYARVPAAIQRHWQETLGRYLSERRSLRGLILLMDIRRSLTEGDRMLLDWCAHAGMPVHILLTKADKLSRGAGQGVLQRIRTTLQRDYDGVTIQRFSVLKGEGLEQARRVLDAWLEPEAHRTA